MLIVRCVVQSRPGRSEITFQRSFSSSRATVTNGNVVGVCRNASLRETSSHRPSASRLNARQTSSASSSPTRRRDVSCLATAQVRVTRMSSPVAGVKSSSACCGSVGRSATVTANGRASMLPTSTLFNVKPASAAAAVSNDSSTANVQQRLRVTNARSVQFKSITGTICRAQCRQVARHSQH